MAKVTISLEEFDELRRIKETFEKSVKNIREETRKEFIDKVAEMAKEIGHKDDIIKELKNKNDDLVKTIHDVRNELCDVKLDKSSIKIELDMLKKRYYDLFNRFFNLLNRGLLARIFRKGERE